MRHLVAAESMTAEALDGLLRLGLGEAQVAGTRFHQLAPGAQAVAGDGRIRPGGDHEVDARGSLDDQSTEILHRRSLEPVEVVEHDHDVVLDRRQLLEEDLDELVAEPRRGPTERRRCALADLRPGGAERRDQARREAERIRIALVDREPGCRPAEPGRRPLADEHGLPVAGGRDDHRQPSTRTLVEEALESRSPDGELGGVHRWEPCT